MRFQRLISDLLDPKAMETSLGDFMEYAEAQAFCTSEIGLNHDFDDFVRP